MNHIIDTYSSNLQWNVIGICLIISNLPSGQVAGDLKYVTCIAGASPKLVLTLQMHYLTFMN